jgi:hypothetical protein
MPTKRKQNWCNRSFNFFAAGHLHKLNKKQNTAQKTKYDRLLQPFSEQEETELKTK